MGDATNLVLILAGELLKVAENLLVMGLHPSEVTQGYELACKKALEEIESMHFYCLPSLPSVTKRLSSTFRVLSSLTTHTLFPHRINKACHCIKTVRIRRYTSIAGRRGCSRRDTSESEKLQRGQRPRCKNYGWKLGEQ